MPEPNRKPEPSSFDPNDVEKLLEIELMQKRHGWEQAKQRRAGIRLFSFFFLVLVIAGALYAFTVFLSPERRQEMRAKAAHKETPTVAPAATP